MHALVIQGRQFVGQETWPSHDRLSKLSDRLKHALVQVVIPEAPREQSSEAVACPIPLHLPSLFSLESTPFAKLLSSPQPSPGGSGYNTGLAIKAASCELERRQITKVPALKYQAQVGPKR